VNTKPTNSGTELNPTTNWYDLFFRNYDPVLGRMNQVDPVASKYASFLPRRVSASGLCGTGIRMI
jgi:hypothetical protein